MVRSCGGRRKLRGAGFMGFIKKVGNFFKKSKILSRVAPIIGTLTGRPGIGSAVGGVASVLGLGRRRRRHRRKHLMGGSAHFRTAQLLGVSQPNVRLSRLSRSF